MFPPSGFTLCLLVQLNVFVRDKMYHVLQNLANFVFIFWNSVSVVLARNNDSNSFRPGDTLVPEVFLFFPMREPQSGEHESRSGEHESRSSEKEKPLVTLDLNLTFMQTPAVKRVKFIITKRTNGKSALPIKRTNHIDLRVCKNINQSEPEGQILTLASA